MARMMRKTSMRGKKTTYGRKKKMQYGGAMGMSARRGTTTGTRMMRGGGRMKKRGKC